jgi:hypothetical protein
MAKSNSTVVAQLRQERWRELLGRWQSSGLSQAEFCRRRGVPVWKFLWWKKRLGIIGAVRSIRNREGSRAITPRRRAEQGGSTFVPIQLVTASSASDWELILRGGRVLRFRAEVEVTKLTEIVAALEALPC